MKIIKLCTCIFFLNLTVACSEQVKPVIPVLPVIQLRMEAPVSEVQAKSSYQFDEKFMQGVPGKEYISVPHVLVYKDADLEFRIEKASNVNSLATYLGYKIRHREIDPESIISDFSFYPIDDYVNLHASVELVKKFRDDFLAQGFTSKDQPWQSFYKTNTGQPEMSLTSFEGIESFFLNSQFYIKDLRAVVLEKNNMQITMDICNLRRRWGSRTDREDVNYAPVKDRIAREIKSMTQEDLKTEPSYSVKITFSPTMERFNQL
ncbi:hypothetical protein [Undibacterium pigrum]|uniref:Lipoprotein n=1 Tax=Undibacterium pigrum TaxID=401470 RepID=A0A318IJZ5_9BURK|nr:hypothetical protein [Undibacterium pigrum]PXX33476.1 hypothetical protein DFR42_1335 [Undibacterium pigrum]